MSDRTFELEVERMGRMLRERAMREYEKRECGVTVVSPLTAPLVGLGFCPPRFVFGIDEVLDEAPAVEAELLRHVTESHPAVWRVLLDAMATIYALRIEVGELNDRLESAGDYRNSYW